MIETQENTLSSKEIAAQEAHREARDRTEDLAYTLNHAIACTATDFIDPEVSRFVQNHGAKYAPGWMQPYLAKFRIGCGCAHHGHGPRS